MTERVEEIRRLSRERLLLILSTKPLSEAYDELDAHLSAVYKALAQAEREREELQNVSALKDEDRLRLQRERDAARAEVERLTKQIDNRNRAVRAELAQAEQSELERCVRVMREVVGDTVPTKIIEEALRR